VAHLGRWNGDRPGAYAVTGVALGRGHGRVTRAHRPRRNPCNTHGQTRDLGKRVCFS
jgi:hypothetical protein